MIPISEVLEVAARECDKLHDALLQSPGEFSDGSRIAALQIADEIRALAAKWEGCIVAEGKAGAYTILDKLRLPKDVEVRLSENGYVPQLIPRYELTPLYRAKEKSK